MSDLPSAKINTDDATPEGFALRSEVIDLVVGLALIGLAIAFWFGAAEFAEVDASGIGPATFPKGIAALLGVAALMLVARAIAGLCGWSPAGITVTERPLAVLAGMVLVGLFPLLIAMIGCYIASAVWMPALFLVAGYRKPFGIVLYTAAFLLFAKVAFEMILGVRLP